MVAANFNFAATFCFIYYINPIFGDLFIMIYTDSLKRNTDFKRLYYRGKSKGGKNLVVYAFKKRQQTTNLGITVSKKVGNAVTRNRTRRIIKEAYRQLEKTGNYMGYDFVIVARASAASKKSTQLQVELKKHMDVVLKLCEKKKNKK